MGNVEGRPQERPVIEVSHKTARPLPPLPDNDEEEDLDSPPPYPPPPPPHDDNGGKSKRISWRFRDSNLFGGLKRGSWALHTQNGNDIYKYNDDNYKNSQNVPAKNLSNTIATEDNSVVTVSVIGTPDKSNLSSEWKENSNSTFDANNLSGDKNNWAVKNMQLVLNKEMGNSDVSSYDVSYSKNINKSSSDINNYPYPDVQINTENDRSSLPDLISVKTRSETTSRSSALTTTTKTVNTQVLSETQNITVKRVEDIRLDYPEGKVKEISHYSSFEFDSEPNERRENLQVDDTPREKQFDAKSDSSSSSSSSVSSISPKPKRSKLGACFGKRKSDDITDDADKCSSKDAYKRTKHKVDNPDLECNQDAPSPKKQKKAKFGACFGKELTPDKDGAKHSEDDSKNVSLSKTDQGEEREKTPSLNNELKIEDRGHSNKKKAKFGSCFGKPKPSTSLDKDLNLNNDSNLKVDLNVDQDIKMGDKSPEFNLSANDIDLTYDKPKIESSLNFNSVELKDSDTNNKEYPKTEFDLKGEFPDMKFKDYVDTPDFHIDKDNLAIDSKNYATPKQDMQLQGRCEIPKGEFNQNIDISVKKPELEFKSPEYNKNIDISIKEPELNLTLPETNLQDNIDGSLDTTGKLPATIKFETEMPKTAVSLNAPAMQSQIVENEYEVPTTNLDLKLPNIQEEFKSEDSKVDIKTPSFNVEVGTPEEASLKISPPEVKYDLPTIKLKSSDPSVQVGVDGDIKATPPQPKKEKFNFGSCFGNKKSTESSLEAPEVGKPIEEVDIKLQGKLDAEMPDAKFETPKKKSKFGACLGKDNSQYSEKEVPYEGKESHKKVEVKVGGSSDVDVPEFSVSNSKAPKKEKNKFGSCFGKSPKSDLKIEGDVDLPFEKLSKDKNDSYDINIQTPEMKFGQYCADSKIPTGIEVNTPQVSLESNANGIDHAIPEIATTSSGNIEVDFPKINMNVEGKSMSPKLNIETNIKNIGVETPKLDLEIDKPSALPEFEMNSPEINLPSSNFENKNLEIKSPNFDIKSPDMNIKAPNVDIKSPNVDVKSPDIDIKVPNIEIKSPNVDVKSPDIDIKGPNIDIKSPNFDIKAPNIDIKSPNVELKAPSVEIKAPSIDIQMPTYEINESSKDDIIIKPEITSDTGDIEMHGSLKMPKGEISTPHIGLSADAKIPEIKDLYSTKLDKPEITPEISVDTDANLQLPSKNVVVKKPKSKFPSCFGKKRASIDGGDPDDIKASLDMEAPRIEGGATHGELSLPRISAEAGIDGENNVKMTSKSKSKFPSCFGKKERNAEEELPSLSQDIKTSGKIKTPKVEGDMPSAELRVPNIEGEVNVETDANLKPPSKSVSVKKPKSKFPSCFGKKDHSMDGDASGDMKASVDIEAPKIEGELRSAELNVPKVSGEAGVEGDADIRMPRASVEVKKPKSKFPSCFGKKDHSMDGNISGGIDGSVDVEAPKIEGELPSAELHVPKVSGEAGVEGDADIILPRASVEVKKPKSKFPSCFGKKEHTIKGEVPQLSGDIKVETPKLEGDMPSGTIRAPSIEGDLEGTVNLGVPKMEGKISSGEIGVPSVGAEADSNIKIDSKSYAVKKPKSKFPSCFGKKEYNIKGETPENLDYKASVDIKVPDINNDTPSVELKDSIDVPDLQFSGGHPSISKDTTIEIPKVNLTLEGDSSAIDDKNFKIDLPTSDICIDLPQLMKPDVTLQADLENSKLNVESPELRIRTPDIDVNVPSAEIREANKPELLVEQKSLHLPEHEAKIFESDLKVNYDIDYENNTESFKKDLRIPPVEVDTNLSLGNIGLEARDQFENKEELNISLKSDTLEESQTKSFNKPKLTFGSFLGKSKTSIEPPEVEIGELQGSKSKLSLELQTPDIPEIGVIYPEDKEKTEASKLEIESKPLASKDSKMKGKACSCLGKPSKDEPYVPSADQKADISGVPEYKVKNIEVVKTSYQLDPISLENSGVTGRESPGLKIKVASPDLKTEAESGEVQFRLPEVDIKTADGPISSTAEAEISHGARIPEYGGKAQGPSKINILNSCFGKIDSKDVEKETKVDIPGNDTLVNDKNLDNTTDKDSENKPKREKGSLFGSCVGKGSKGKLDIDQDGKPYITSPVDIKLINTESENVANKPNIDADIRTPELEKQTGTEELPKLDLLIENNYPKASNDIEINDDNDKPSIEANINTNIPFQDPKIHLLHERRRNLDNEQAEILENKTLGRESAPDSENKVGMDTNLSLPSYELNLNLPEILRDTKEFEIKSNLSPPIGSINIDSTLEEFSSIVKEIENSSKPKQGEMKLKENSDMNFNLEFDNVYANIPNVNVECTGKVADGAKDVCMKENIPEILKDTSYSDDANTKGDYAPPLPPKRWYGIDKPSSELDSYSTDKSDSEKPGTKAIDPPSETISDFNSIQFVKQMVKGSDKPDDQSAPSACGDKTLYPQSNTEMVFGELGPISISTSSSAPSTVQESDELLIPKLTLQGSSDLLTKKLGEFDNEDYNSQPIVKRIIKVKTFKPKEGSQEPEEIIEEFEAEGEELKYDAKDILMKKLAELEMNSDCVQPVIKRTVKIKTYKTKEGSDDPQEVIEEFEDESDIPFKQNEQIKYKVIKRETNEGSQDVPKDFTCEEGEAKTEVLTASGSSVECGPSEMLIQKIADWDVQSSQPLVKRTVKVKTYSTREGTNEPEEVYEEFEGSEDTTLDKNDARHCILKRIADFDGKGISGEPFVKRTIKVKSYKTAEGSNEPEVVEEFEHNSDDTTLSDILRARFPGLNYEELKSSEIFGSSFANIPNVQTEELLEEEKDISPSKLPKKEEPPHL